MEIQSLRKHLVATVVFSVLLGAIAGYGAGFVTVQKMLDSDQYGQGSARTEGQTYRVIEESDLIGVVKDTQQSVVSILISRDVSLYDTFANPLDYFNETPQNRSESVKQQVGGGSGFIVSADGLILTNRHVVTYDDADYTVVMSDGTEYPAKVIDRDAVNDLAFVKIEASGLKPLALGDSDALQIGQTVIAIGNTLSEYSNTVTKGIISGIDRKLTAGGADGVTVLESAIQTDAAINPGNSGGPLINLEGEVVGINTAVNREGEGLGFAIPINEAKQLIDDVITSGRIIRPFLGVHYQMLNERIAKRNNLPIDYGAIILGDGAKDTGVVPDSPAAKAGLKENDIIYQVGESKVTLDDGLSELLSKYKPGDSVTLKVRRGTEDLTLTATLIERE